MSFSSDFIVASNESLHILSKVTLITNTSERTVFIVWFH